MKKHSFLSTYSALCYSMYRALIVGWIVAILSLQKVENADTFIPGGLGASVQRLCQDLQNRIHCPENSCSGSQKKCSNNSQCSCIPTRMEVCCSTPGNGAGCCVNVPLPLAVGR